ncbi:MAG TPA: HEAT repeat domain-containing protein [Candidatus Sulfotelmatobacter sp.]|jgi:HEAT repeat protein|nr:HEAT repeat domain-containing protein [Candidatus Sulfotelmatobacter sp.]
MSRRPDDAAGLLRALDDPEGEARAGALEGLVAAGTAAVPALTEALGDRSVGIRCGAAIALGRMGEAAKPAIPALMRALRQGVRPQMPDLRDPRADAAKALGALRAAEALPALIESLADPNTLCVAAALALAKLGDRAATAPLVAVLLDANKFWVPRGAAAVALGNLGRVAADAVPALETALTFVPDEENENWDGRAREAVADALRRIADPSLPTSLKGKGYRYEMWGIF